MQKAYYMSNPILQKNATKQIAWNVESKKRNPAYDKIYDIIINYNGIV